MVRAMTLVGRAMPVLVGDVYEESVSGRPEGLSAKPFGLMLEALDDLKTNEIYIATGSSPRNALWGEMMSTRARSLGSKGAVLNGYVRDTRALLDMNFATFSFGSYGQDSSPRCKVHDFRVPIEIGGVRINPGDLVFGDIDGVLVVPAEHEEEVFAKALEKVRAEKTVRQELESGSSAVSAFARHGIM